MKVSTINIIISAVGMGMVASTIGTTCTLTVGKISSAIGLGLMLTGVWREILSLKKKIQ